MPIPAKTRARAAVATATLAGRRSPCPLACSLDLFGDRWTLLVVRDLMRGATRFKELAAGPEGIPTNILSERLKRLLRGSVIEPAPASDGSKHRAYRLTSKGEALRPVLAAVRDWGLAWEKGTRVMVASTGTRGS